VTKLNPSGSAPLIYSTFVGGGALEFARDLAVDASGSAYVTGLTFSPNFPVTADAFDTTWNNSADAFVTKLNPFGSALVYSTFLGGTATDVGNGIAVDTSGNAYVTGETLANDFPTTVGAFDTTHNGAIDAFVTKLSTITSGVPVTLTLNPPTASNPVDSEHCVTATVQDASGNPVANVVVRFQVMGSVDTRG
jgi:hypothetical protein